MNASDRLGVLMRFFGWLRGSGSFECWGASLSLLDGDVVSDSKLHNAHTVSWESVDFLTSQTKLHGKEDSWSLPQSPPDPQRPQVLKDGCKSCLVKQMGSKRRASKLLLGRLWDIVLAALTSHCFE